MKASIQSTSQIIEVNGIPARVWKGKTEKGIECEFLVTLVAVSKDRDCSQFEQELQEQHAPHVSEAFPLKLIL